MRQCVPARHKTRRKTHVYGKWNVHVHDMHETLNEGKKISQILCFLIFALCLFDSVYIYSHLLCTTVKGEDDFLTLKALIDFYDVQSMWLWQPNIVTKYPMNPKSPFPFPCPCWHVNVQQPGIAAARDSSSQKGTRQRPKRSHDPCPPSWMDNTLGWKQQANDRPPSSLDGQHCHFGCGKLMIDLHHHWMDHGMATEN